MARVVIENLVKTYPEARGPAVRAVNNVCLTIEDGEFMVLVGPSGCGKSTTLRMIAGLEEISGGTVAIDGKVVNHVLPKDRDIAMVFQNYALYPHLSVYDNLAFGLKLRKFSKVEIDLRVREAAALLGLDPYLARKPKALSGGQRQRVAVGRAIVRQPKVFLFDEPLSNLDAKMRVSTRAEISKLHRQLGVTMIYVTHDQIEAMTMGDRICVMRDGLVMQVAAPLTLYNCPGNLFVAGFIGSPPMNLIRGTIQPAQDALQFVETSPASSPATITLNSALAARAAAYTRQPVVFGIRPEDLHDARTFPPGSQGATINTRVDYSEPMGAETLLYLNTGATSLIARARPTDRFEPGQQVEMTCNLENAHLFDPATELVI